MTAVSGGGANDRLQDPVRIIHKDQEGISAFCINSVSWPLKSLKQTDVLSLTFPYCV